MAEPHWICQARSGVGRGASGVPEMKRFETLERKYHRGRRFQFIRTALEAGNSDCDCTETGHVHTGGTVDIPFPHAIRDALLVDSLAWPGPPAGSPTRAG